MSGIGLRAGLLFSGAQPHPHLNTSQPGNRCRSALVRTLALALTICSLLSWDVQPLWSADKPVDPQHPLAPALEHAYQSREALSQVADYEAVFSKREMIDRRMVAATMRLKLREEPYSVYMQFENPHKGREVLYVSGQNNGMLLAHEAGFKSIAGTVSLATDSKDAMEDNRYPITMIGMRNLLNKIIQQWEAEAQFGEVDVKYFPDATIAKTVPCKVIQSEHPKPRKQFKFQRTRLYIEKETGYPVRVEQWAFGNTEPILVEEYTYSRIKVNLGLQDRDFDKSNPSYAFP